MQKNANYLASVVGAALVLLGANAEAATVYVDNALGSDANSGLSAQRPWKSFARVNQTQFQPGDTVFLAANSVWGDDTGLSPIQLHPKGSGDPTTNCASGYLKIDRYGSGSKPKILGGGGGAGWRESTPTGAVHLRDQSCWEIRNLEVTNTSPFGSELVGIKVEATHPSRARHIYIGNNVIHDIGGHVDGFYASNAAIAVTADMNTWDPCPDWPDACPPNPTWSDVIIENNTIYSVDRIGIYVGFNYQAPTSKEKEYAWTLFDRISDVKIRGNKLDQIGGDGILTVAASGVMIERNAISNSGTRIIPPEGCGTCPDNGSGYTSCNSAGIWTAVTDHSVIQYNEVYNYALPASGTTAMQCDGQAFDADQGTTSQVVQYNYSHNNGGGMMLFCEVEPFASGALALNDIQVRYNVSYNDVRGAFSFNCDEGTFPVGPITTRIHNNLVYSAGAVTRQFTASGEGILVGGAAEIYNNIFYVKSGTTSYPSLPGAKFRNNVFYGAQSSVPAGVLSSTLDPLLVQPGAAGLSLTGLAGLRLVAGSPAVGSGVNGVLERLGPVDFWGNAIPASGPVNRGPFNGPGLATFGPDNIAFGATVSSPRPTYEGEGWGRQKAVDGRRDSIYGLSEGITSEGYADPSHAEEFIIDFGQLHTVSKVVLFPRNDSGYVGGGFPVDFTIDVWNGSTWVTRVARTGYSFSGNTGKSFSWGFDTTTRIRVRATKLGLVPGYGYHLQFAEIEIY